jgi:hypothetical protein
METGPLDLDRTARVEGVRDLILSVHLGSDGSGWLGARGGGVVTPATQSRGGAAQGSPDLTVNGAPGVKLGSASCVIFLGLKQVSGCSGLACAAAGAVLHGGAHRRAAFRSLR